MKLFISLCFSKLTTPVLLLSLLLSISHLSYAQSVAESLSLTNASSSSNDIATAMDALQSQASGVPGIPAFTMTPRNDGGEDYTVTLQILALMTALTLLPSFLLMMTSFTRIIIVFAILRQALGLQQTPSNQIMLAGIVFNYFYYATGL